MQETHVLSYTERLEEAQEVVMRRIIVRLSAFVMSFLIGFGCSVAVKNYIKNSFADAIAANGHHTELVVTIAAPFPVERYETHLPPGSLPAELKRIDEHYQKLCALPTDWAGEWSTMKQLVAFRSCNEEWANARRHAISAEITNYLIQY